LEPPSRREWCTTALAGLLATVINVLASAAFLDWKSKTSGCQEQQVDAALYRTGESILKNYAQGLETDLNGEKAFHDFWDLSVHAEGRNLISTYRFNKSVDPASYHDLLNAYEKGIRWPMLQQAPDNLKGT
jgi:hypothetical protein